MIYCKPLPTLARLRWLLALRSDGVLIWKRPTSNRVRPGMEAGRWSKKYRYINIDGKAYPLHRIVWALSNNRLPGQLEIDHINGNPADNRPQNLRACSREQNMLNSRLRSDNTSGLKGVSYDPSSKSKPWRSYFKTKRLGRFATEKEAFDALQEFVAKTRESCYYRTDSAH